MQSLLLHARPPEARDSNGENLKRMPRSDMRQMLKFSLHTKVYVLSRLACKHALKCSGVKKNISEGSEPSVAWGKKKAKDPVDFVLMAPICHLHLSCNKCH